jgi:hypothetical protein
MLHNGSYVISDYLDGQIDELRIWNYQKNNQQILELKDEPLDSAYYVSSDSGLVGYWRFDVLEDLGINNDGPDDIRDLSISGSHLDLAGDAHLVPFNGVATIMLEKTFGGIGPERGIGIDLTTDGGYIIGGSTASFTSNEIMFLIKLDSLGILKWSKGYNAFGFDKIHCVKQSPDGGFYLSGFVEGGFGFFDHAIIKVDFSGEVIWAKNFGGIEADESRRLVVTADGGLLVTGYNASFGVGAKELQAIKLSSNGNIEWAKTYGTLYEDFGSSCMMASDGNYILAGALDISGSYDIRPTLIKIDTLGNIIWAKYFSGYLEDWGRDLIETMDGGFLLSGDTRSYGLAGSQDIVLIKTDPNGNVSWAKAYGGTGNETGYALITGADGKYFVSGYTSSFGFGGYDAFLMKVDTNGLIEWFHTYGGNTNDYAYDLIQTNDMGIAITGRRSSNTLGGDDLYFIKTDEHGYSPCNFGVFNPNVFNITTLEAIVLNLATNSTISVSDLNLMTITLNTGQNNSCGIIPVELKSFGYNFENKNVVLNWITLTETNNLGFRILRDEDEIGFVSGVGTTTEPREYFYTDQNVSGGVYIYTLIQIDYDGYEKRIGEIEVVVSCSPADFKLEQNYPNPFNPNSVIRYSIPKRSYVQLIIYNTVGQEVRKLVDEYKDPGFYQVELNGSNLPSGIYFYCLKNAEFTDIKKMVLLK